MPNHHLAIHLRSLLLAGLWLLTTACHADQPAWQGVWSGTIGKSEVRVCLDEKGKSAYRYQRYQKDIPLVLKGNQWQETSDGKVTGIWTLGNPQDDTLDGIWYNPKSGRSLPINLERMKEEENAGTSKVRLYPCGDLERGNSNRMHTSDLSPNKRKDMAEAKFVTVSDGRLGGIVATHGGKVIVVVRGDGAIIRSIDGGNTWSSVRTGISENLIDVVFN